MRLSISFLFTLLIATFTIVLAAPLPSRTSVTDHSGHYLKDLDHSLGDNAYFRPIEAVHNLQPRADRTFKQKVKAVVTKIKNVFTGGKNKKKPAKEPNKGKNRKSVLSWGSQSHASTRWSRMSGVSQPNTNANRNSRHHRREIEFEELEQLE
jgi:hypothetical protein